MKNNGYNIEQMKGWWILGGKFLGIIAIGVFLLFISKSFTRPASTVMVSRANADLYEVEIEYNSFKKVIDTCSWCDVRKKPRSVKVSLSDMGRTELFKRCFDLAKVKKYNGSSVVIDKNGTTITLPCDRKYVTVPTVMVASMIDNGMLIVESKEKIDVK